MPPISDIISFLQDLNLAFVQFVGNFVGGPENALVLLFAIAKIKIILAHVLGIIPMIIYAERKIIGFVQDRPGPNRVGPFGILQGVVDGAKLFLKEDMIPSGADRTLYLLGPALTLIPAFLAMCIIPFGPVIDGQALYQLYSMLGVESLYQPATSMTAGSSLALAITNPNVGILYVFAITSVGVYGITLAGWSSENKWSLLGGIRASAQMISYEISLSLSIIGVLLIVGSLNLYDIIDHQKYIWQWNVWAQPVAALIFLVAIFAETNRLPFDLAEGEAELTGGFHTEYSSMKFALFFLAEYVNMITAAAVLCTLFLGGYHLIPMEWAVALINGVLDFAIRDSEFSFVIPSETAAIIAALGAPLALILKIAFIMYLFIVARAALPRLRYDQVMDLGWKVLLVAGLINLVITAVGVAILSGIGVAQAGPNASLEATQQSIDTWVLNGKIAIGIVTGGLLLMADRIHARNRRNELKSNYRTYKGGEATFRPV